MAGRQWSEVGWGMPAIGRHGSEDHITPRCYYHTERTLAELAENTAYSAMVGTLGARSMIHSDLKAAAFPLRAPT